MGCVKMLSRSAEETEDIGFKIGRFLKTKGRGAVCLYGDLGAGKTTLIKGIAAAFGIPKRDIGSASFIIAAEYETKPAFYHIDLYRIETEDECEAADIWEYIESGVSAIEWAERLSEIPEGSITVKMSFMDESGREIIIEGIDEEDWDHM
jgi:tRNA threonylcarbamoyladenosine biosynthesis protein TsaE